MSPGGLLSTGAAVADGCPLTVEVGACEEDGLPRVVGVSREDVGDPAATDFDGPWLDPLQPPSAMVITATTLAAPVTCRRGPPVDRPDTFAPLQRGCQRAS
ncbi:MAG: hypothetical protein DLM56_06390 [Pseudonocardiales bacterium]|nr:MAG: hypothetical protein DLM56_06390 [Pseudonocardiales bacterium]